MHLVSYRLRGAFEDEPGRDARLGILDDHRVVAAADLLPAGPETMADLLASLPAGLDALRRAWSERRADDDIRGAAPLVNDVELLAPVPRPPKIVAIGINYRSHAAEQGREAPTSPVIFAKFPSAVVGPGSDVTWDPALTQAVDFEAELAVVMGPTARRVPAERALDHVLGYTCLNDVSARDLQYADKQFTRAKSLDTFSPMGPVLVTADQIPDPGALAIRCLVNGEVMQDSTTADLVFGVPELIAFCSRAFTLEPGDVIATGTPGGVGWFREPKRMLRDGDEVTVEIELIGRLVNRFREEPSPA